jgi:hypothetical protein
VKFTETNLNQMKKLIVLAFAITSISLGAYAQQKVSASKVPPAVKTSFAKQFPGTKVSWELENGNYEAGFEQQGHEMAALFQANGALIESEVEIKISELPATVTDYVKSHYKGSKIKEAAKITKASGEVNYEAEVNGKDVIFDSNGNPVK